MTSYSGQTLFDITLENGKYRLFQTPNGALHAERHGEAWISFDKDMPLPGSKMFIAMAHELEQARASLEQGTPQASDYRGQRIWSPDRPRDPRCAHLEVTEVELSDARRTLRLDRNQITIAFLEGVADTLEPVASLKSIISGEPAVILRTSEAELHLTPEEADRFIKCALKPEQFTAICDAIGATWELHDDFYDVETGQALQPKTERYAREFYPDEGSPQP